MSNLDLTLSEVLDVVGGGEIVGDSAFRCVSVASLDAAGPEQLSYVKHPRYESQALASRAGALIVGSRIVDSSAHQVVVSDPQHAFGLVLQRIGVEKRRQPPGVDPRAYVYDGAELGTDVTIGPGAVVREGARLGDRVVLYPGAYVGQRSNVGDDSVLYPNVVVLEDVAIGRRALIHAGAVIGGDGYGFAQVEGRQVKIPQIGAIEIGDDVEIGALATIDRATLDKTVIGNGTKIGDLVHVAHNCQIGNEVLLLPTAAIAGSVKMGDRVIVAGRGGVIDNLTVGDDAVLGACSVTFQDVPEGATMWGNPARDKGLEIRIQALLRRLPQMYRDLSSVKKRLEL